MRVLPYTNEAYDLMHQGSIAMAKIEAAGIRVDVPYIHSALEKTKRDIEDRKKKLADSKVMRKWRRRFGTKTNINSNEQLGTILFDVMGFECLKRTGTGKYKTDEETLQLIDHPFVRDWIRIKKIHKGRDFLKGILEEVCDGFLHPVFSLHIPKSFRSSSEDPNFQNTPVRVDWLRELVRRAILARPGRRIVEIDYKGIEVCGAYCYHKDPNMRKYLLNKSTDLHRDMAMECYILIKEEITKLIRYSAKNQFVFPQFYGAWWLDCAAGLWQIIDTLKLKTESGIPLKEHLKKQGIKRLGDQNREDPNPKPGTFEYHIATIEKHFWGERFPGYAKWKKQWYEEYLRTGWFQMLTGYICQGFMVRNEVLNLPIQGSSFHCLLWSLIQIVNHELRKARMKAQVIGQIHDSIVGDVPDEEVPDYIALCREIMTKKLLEAWSWIIIPLEIEVEVTPVGGSWVEKEEWKK